MTDNTNEFFLIPTALGRAMIADSIATGEDINLTMVAVGDADYTPTDGQTALLNERARVEIADIVRDEQNPAHLKICAILPPDVGGWRIHEVGILAENGNLFAVGKMDGSYKPLYNTGMTKEVLLELRLEVGAEPNINLVIDPHVIIATRQWVTEYLNPWKELWQAHIRDRGNPHQVTIEQIPGLADKLDKIGPGKHLAEPFFHPDPDPPVGAIRARGETFHRGQYAALWAEVQRLHNKCVALGLPPLLVSDSDWQTEATTQGGYCAKYSTGDGSTTFRVPFYGRMFGAATTDAEINKWVNDAIVNITGTFLGYDYENDSPASWSGAFTRNNAHKSAAAGNAQYGETPTYFDASRVVRTGPEVTPKAVYLPVYIHAFHAIQDSAVLQAQETLNALNAKLDAADYSGFPSDTYIDIPWGGSGMVYTAPADGWIFMDRTSSAAGQMVIMLVLTTGFFTSTYASGPGQRLGIFLPLSKGQTVEIHYNAPTPNYLAFIPARRAPGL